MRVEVENAYIRLSALNAQVCAVTHMLPTRVHAYINEIIKACSDGGRALASLVVFGSAAIGGFSDDVSDVDLILVVPDDASERDRTQLRECIERLEIIHGFRHASSGPQWRLEAIAEAITANACSFFVCTRSDFLSGNIGRILGIPPSQARFVDRAVLANIVASAVVVWGENLLPHVPVLPLRRFDVLKAGFGLLSQALISAAVFPLLPRATGYAMGVLKRSVHNCFFCYELRRASLEQEVEFFETRLGRSRTLRTLVQLLKLRRQYRKSFAFVAACLPTLLWLHFRTAVDNGFPREIKGG